MPAKNLVQQSAAAKEHQLIQNPNRIRIVLLAIAFAAGSSSISPAMAQSGDMNCDGAFNIADIPLFVDSLLTTGTFGGCDISRADMNADGLINGRDTQPFVAALLAPCPPGLSLCGGVCVDLMWDGMNCGFCGNMCAPQDYCAWGACTGFCIGCPP